MRIKIPVIIKYFLKVYLLGLAIFTLFRFLLLASNGDRIEGIPFATFFDSFLMGFRFDTVISGYIITIPFVIFTLLLIVFPKINFKRFLFPFFAVVYPLTFLICVVDIPVFDQFNSRLTIIALSWMDSPGFVFGMIFSDWKNYLYLFLLIAICWFYYRVLKAISTHNEEAGKGRIRLGIWFLIVMILISVGIRGRLSLKSPIRWGTAYFSQYDFANQLALNPCFTLMRSYLDSFDERNSRIQLMDDLKAINTIQYSLGITQSENLGSAKSPIARPVKVLPGLEWGKANVVLVVVESLSASFMQRYGSDKILTPKLDALANYAVTFDNFFSAGIHTQDGIHSSFFSMPSILDKHPMKSMDIHYGDNSLINVFNKEGYKTTFFCPHDAQFDNMEGFCMANGFSEVIDEDDFPEEKVLSSLGVPDHILFDECIKRFNKSNKENTPFFGAILTGSNHMPFIIPDDIDFDPGPGSKQDQVLRYTDWSISRFLDLASNEAWYSNTIFVLTGDHGIPVDPVYDIDLSQFHVPLMIFVPNSELKGGCGLYALSSEFKTNPIGGSETKIFGGQVDIIPTILGMLNVEYVNTTMGTDLLDTRLRFPEDRMYFSADDKFGCIDDSLLYIQRRNGEPSLFRYRAKDRTNYLKDYADVGNNMKEYAESHIQAAQYLMTNRWESPGATDHSSLEEK